MLASFLIISYMLHLGLNSPQLLWLLLSYVQGRITNRESYALPLKQMTMGFSKCANITLQLNILITPKENPVPLAVNPHSLFCNLLPNSLLPVTAIISSSYITAPRLNSEGKRITLEITKQFNNLAVRSSFQTPINMGMLGRRVLKV